jgi:spermidine synthase
LKKIINRTIDRHIRNVIIATGIGSVTTQLLTIREFLSLLNGNEFVIAVIIFNWLFLGGLGTLLAGPLCKNVKNVSLKKFYWFSILLVILAPVQLIIIRKLYPLIFIHGSSIGFYPTFAYIFFLIAPYSLLLGFILPYSLIVIRNQNGNYSGTSVYIYDNIGDICGGAIFSFILVYYTTPLQAVFLGHLPLLAALSLLYISAYNDKSTAFFGFSLGLLVLLSSVYAEISSLTPQNGELAYYQETPYGRIQIIKDQEQFTLFQNGRPTFSSQDLIYAEEVIHYPLSQIDSIRHVLLISAEKLMISEVKKYHPESIDYIEINPAITDVEFRFGLLEKFPEMLVIHQDGRRYLTHTHKQYDAIILNLPEPDTFQINRFFTEQFFSIARQRLSDNGVLSFSVKGFDNYISENELVKISSIYRTVAQVFPQVLMIPGSRIFFLCSKKHIQTDITGLLENKNISTAYISGYYDGNITPERISRLNQQLMSSAPVNSDFSPHLVRILLDEWFSIFSTSPILFVLILSVINIFYLCVITKEEFVLYTTGFFTMGSEILVIFAFQIFFGYIYLQIGLIVTVFLAGILPGAIYGEYLRKRGKPILIFTDLTLIALMIVFICGITLFSVHLSGYVFLAFGFAVSVACGCQFPVALHLQGGDKPAAVKMFSADLIGAAYGTILTSILLIPFAGILWTAAGMILLKLTSLIIINSKHENRFTKKVFSK